MKDTLWIYPGSFDPLTYGHIDIISRAASMCGKLVVAVLKNKEKSSLFSIDERVNMIKNAVSDMDNVTAMSFGGLLVDFYEVMHADAVVRGVRDQTDYEYELREARINQMLHPGYETVVFFNDSRYAVVSSSTVRELASFGGDVGRFVPPHIEAMVKSKFKEKYT